MFWSFVIYSFLGFLLEVLFARAVGHPKRDRKCLLLLPLCPVYGIGALAIRWLTAGNLAPLWVMGAGFVAATAAELVTGLFYRHVLGVEFWNYRDLRWNLGGLVCLQFSLCWTVLALVMVYAIDPAVQAFAAGLPAWLGPPAVILTAADAAVSALALRRTGDTQVLRWYAGEDTNKGKKSYNL